MHSLLHNIKISWAYVRVFIRREVKKLPRVIGQNRANLILGTILVALLVFFTYQVQISLPKNAVSEGIIGTYTQDDLPPLLTKLLSRSLITIDQNGQTSGDLVRSIQENEDGTVYILTLKDNLFWADRTPVKSNDIVLSFSEAQISYPNDKTIQFKLPEPFSPFLSLLTKPVFKRTVGVGIGIGPYTVTQIKREDNFVRQVNLRSLTSNLPDLVVNFYPNEKIAETALELGNVQSLLGVSDTSPFSDQSTYTLYNRPNYQQLVAIFYNTKDPILSDDNFRLALSFAAPSIFGENAANTSIPPTSWVFNSDVKDYLDNPAQAKQYLSKVKNGRDSTITLTATNFLQGVGEKVVAEWNKEGIRSQLKVESGIPQNFQALLIAQNIPADPDQYSLWHSTQSQTNISQMSNPRIDKDLEDGRKATDSAVRKQRYQDFQKVLLDHAPATFLYFPKYNVVMIKKAQPGLEKVLKIQI